MKIKSILFFAIFLVIILIAGGVYLFIILRPKKETSLEPKIKGGNMKISSPAFENNGTIPAKYTCDGENISPPLQFEGISENAQSLTLIMDDPDAPAGTWVHWTAWNIDPKTQGFNEGSAPQGTVEGVTSFGSSGYGGPCPPSGTHRYFFKIYALNKKIDLSPQADKSKLEEVMNDHVLAKGELIGLYGRK